MKRKLNKKGVAMLLVAILIVAVVPFTLIIVNLSSSQKKQAIHFNQRLNVDQITLSGINKGYNYLKNPHLRPPYKQFSADLSGSDRFDLYLSHTGKGFFKQDIYMMVSKSNKGDLESTIMADAEQFQIEADNPNTVMVLTHDYWSTPMRLEITKASDLLTVKNFRGKDQLRAMDVKKFEMEASPSQFQTAMSSLGTNLPKEVKSCWDTVVKNMVADKIRSADSEYTPPSTTTSSPGSGSTSGTPSSKPGKPSQDSSDDGSNTSPSDSDTSQQDSNKWDPSNPTGWDEEDAGAEESEAIYQQYNQKR